MLSLGIPLFNSKGFHTVSLNSEKFNIVEFSNVKLNMGGLLSEVSKLQIT